MTDAAFNTLIIIMCGVRGSVFALRSAPTAPCTQWLLNVMLANTGKGLKAYTRGLHSHDKRFCACRCPNFVFSLPVPHPARVSTPGASRSRCLRRLVLPVVCYYPHPPRKGWYAIIIGYCSRRGGSDFPESEHSHQARPCWTKRANVRLENREVKIHRKMMMMKLTKLLIGGRCKMSAASIDEFII